jgi:hypothetical protein
MPCMVGELDTVTHRFFAAAAVFYAAQNAHAECLRALAALGADMDTCCGGRPAVWIAALNGHVGTSNDTELSKV